MYLVSIKVVLPLNIFVLENEKKVKKIYAAITAKAGLLLKIEFAMKRVIENADSLLYQFTSNSVESCNGIISKLIAGKRIHFGNRGSYQVRVKASVIQFNTKQALSSTCHVMGKEPPAYTKIVENRNIKRNEAY